jgi:hypothetical protein
MARCLCLRHSGQLCSRGTPLSLCSWGAAQLLCLGSAPTGLIGAAGPPGTPAAAPAPQSPGRAGRTATASRCPGTCCTGRLPSCWAPWRGTGSVAHRHNHVSQVLVQRDRVRVRAKSRPVACTLGTHRCMPHVNRQLSLGRVLFCARGGAPRRRCRCRRGGGCAAAPPGSGCPARTLRWASPAGPSPWGPPCSTQTTLLLLRDRGCITVQQASTIRWIFVGSASCVQPKRCRDPALPAVFSRHAAETPPDALQGQVVAGVLLRLDEQLVGRRPQDCACHCQTCSSGAQHCCMCGILLQRLRMLVRVCKGALQPWIGGQLTAYNHKRVGCAFHGTHRPLRYVLVCDLVKLVLLYLSTTVGSSPSNEGRTTAYIPGRAKQSFLASFPRPLCTCSPVWSGCGLAPAAAACCCTAEVVSGRAAAQGPPPATWCMPAAHTLESSSAQVTCVCA